MALVDYFSEERIGYITLNRPEKRNALSRELIGELWNAFDQAEQDAGVKVVVLQARGDAFCAGADLAYLQQLQGFSYEENLEDSRFLKRLYEKIFGLTKVVIAQVQGHALAGGCGLATVCDFVFAVPEAKFGYTEVKIGFIPALVMVFLTRKIGEQRARGMLLSGEWITAQQAHEWGLAHRVVPPGELETTVKTFAQKLIANNSGESMRLTKKLLAEVPSLSLPDALDWAAATNAQARGTDDCKKGIAAFLNKQELKW
ncbi:MAG: enoyl-CoA hydratase-related protein [Cyclobacteriaceae bacterium]|jgi:methylglutaconyl-CoA hydratase|nr:enoyl-CoA hydratase-related protein [Cyclobacteriaceae bacterium]